MGPHAMADWPRTDNIEPMDLITILGFGIVTFVVVILIQRFRNNPAEDEESGQGVDQEDDVLRAIRSMKKDRSSQGED